MKALSIALFPKHRPRGLNYSQTIARSLLLKRLALLQQGCLRLHENGQVFSFGQNPEHTSLVADVHIHNPAFYTELVQSGSVGSGEAYISGYWSSPHLTAVIQVFVRNLSALDALDAKQSALGKAALKLFHRLQRNTKAGAKRNIAAHYDLSNPFFSLFLDPRMMYSAAVYPTPSASLAEASTYKLQRICEKLQLQPQDHLLEIGTGWGGLALYAATHFGCRVTTTTISQQQYHYARAQIEAHGLGHRITLLNRDYRDLTGEYSKLVSVEMIEAVGHEHYATYFKTCCQRLAPDGLMLIQAITLPDQRYEQAKNTVDFIQRYIFPGGALPSLSVIANTLSRHTQLNIIHLEDIGDHYAQTLKHWRQSFLKRQADVTALGFNERFIRLWEFYLCYCEGGFLERGIGTLQLLMAKPGYRSPTFN